MQIHVTGKQIDVGDALRGHVDERMGAIVSKYFDRPVDAHVTFSKEGHEFKADLFVHLSTGIKLNAHAMGGDAYGSLELALERLDKRLRRYKRRLKGHHQTREEPLPTTAAASYVIAAESDDDEAEEPSALEPVIIAEDTTTVLTLTVGEAVMQLDLLGQPALLFRNGAHGGLNVVYRRADGNVGWIDPANGEA